MENNCPHCGLSLDIPIDAKVGALDSKWGKTSTTRIVNFYSKVYEKNFGFVPRGMSYPIIGKTFKPILKEFTENQVAIMILIHFNWRGADNTNDFVYKKLLDVSFPLLWLPKCVNQYTAFAVNFLSLDWSDNQKLVEYINKSI